MNKDEKSAWELFETMSDASQHHAIYQHSGKATITTSSSKQRGMYEVNPSNDLAFKVDTLAEKLDQFLTLGRTSTPPPAFQEAFSSFVQEQVNVA